MNKTVRNVSLIIVALLCILTIGFSAFSADMIVNDMIAYIRPKVDVRVTRVALDTSRSSGYTSVNFDYDVSNVTGSFQLNNIGSTITYEVDVTVYGAPEMAIKGVSVGENGSGLTASISGYTLKTKICDNTQTSKCSLNATKTIYVTIERTSGSTVNYNNVRIDFDFQEVFDITYVDMVNTGYPETILTGDDMTITFTNNATYNGTATYTYSTDTLAVTSYTATTPAGFTVNGATADSYSNGVLSITNVTGDVTITKQAASTPNAAQTILSLVDGHSSTSTNIIYLGTGTGGCTKSFVYDGTADKNLRYIGANPCNYVSFANKTWRIVGVFNNIGISGQNDTETLVKLVLNENYLNTKWDTSNTNKWANSSLYKILNTNADSYYTSTLNSSSYVANAVWNLGVGTSRYALSPTNYYTAERSNTAVSGGTSTTTGYVGLLYASDYGFATSGTDNLSDGYASSERNTCVSSQLNSSEWDREEDACIVNDWLMFADYMWTINARYNYTNQVWRMRAYSGIQNVTANGYDAKVRPVIYLKGDVKIASGDGSSGSGAYTLTQ